MPHTQRVTVMPACPASFFEERFPTSGNDKRCDNYYDAMFNNLYQTRPNLQLLKNMNARSPTENIGDRLCGNRHKPRLTNA